MNKAVLILVFLFVMPVTAQEDLPTASRCRARVTAWGEQLQEIDKLSWDVVAKRVLEMGVCGNVDPPMRDDYRAAQGLLNTSLLTRTTDFIKRHNLLSQFELEDAQGKR
jgi:hypothetical protein